MNVQTTPREYKDSPYTLRISPDDWVEVCAQYATVESENADSMAELIKAAPWHNWLIEMFALHYDLIITDPRSIKFFRSNDGKYLEFIAEPGKNAIPRSKA